LLWIELFARVRQLVLDHTVHANDDLASYADDVESYLIGNDYEEHETWMFEKHLYCIVVGWQHPLWSKASTYSEVSCNAWPINGKGAEG
jgi:hypothetical protein